MTQLYSQSFLTVCSPFPFQLAELKIRSNTTSVNAVNSAVHWYRSQIPIQSVSSQSDHSDSTNTYRHNHNQARYTMEWLDAGQHGLPHMLHALVARWHTLRCCCHIVCIVALIVALVRFIMRLHCCCGLCSLRHWGEGYERCRGRWYAN